jgi:hypothetical protein
MSTPSWVGNLRDNGIQADMAKAMSNGTIGYNGLLNVLTDVASRGSVTATEYSDLQTISHGIGDGTTTTPYLSYIFNALVNGDPANATWTGGATVSTPLGNLGAGSSAAQLNDLIGKWFLGTDLPSFAGYGHGASYVTETLPLFGANGAPSVSDINQGAVGDCYFVAALGAIANQAPSAIESMFVDNGNGTYGVRFYLGGTPVYVTVDSQLVSQGGSLLFDRSTTDLWAGLAEKAFAELDSSGYLGRSLPTNSYAAIDNADNWSGQGCMSSDVFSWITDCHSVNYSYSSYNFYNDKQIFINAINSGLEVSVGTFGATQDSNGRTCFVSNHEFYIVGYDSTTGDFILRNPWGVQANQYWNTTFEASMNDIAGVQGIVSVSATANPVVVTPSPHSIGSSGSIALSQLFSVTDSGAASPTYYKIWNLTGGSLQLNGATNLDAYPGTYEFSPSDLARVTFVGGGKPGLEFLTVSVEDSAYQWSDATIVGVTTTFCPVSVTASATTVPSGGALPVQALFSAADSAGAAVTTYRILDPAGGARIALNGAINQASAADQAAGYIQVSAADLGKLTVVGGATIGTTTLTVSAGDGTWWSAPSAVTVTTTSAAVVFSMPTEVATKSSTPLSSFFSAIDFAGNPITAYRITASGLGGTINLNGATNLALQGSAASAYTQVSAADFGKLTYVAGSSAGWYYGTETVTVSAFDGASWSSPTVLSITATSLPVILSARSLCVAPSATIPVSSLFTVADSHGASITQYEIYNVSGGVLSLNGAQNTSHYAWEYLVSAADMAKVTYTPGATSGVHSLSLAASDGTSWSDFSCTASVTVANNGTVAGALSSYFHAGPAAAAAAITDSAATVQANLDALQTLAAAGKVASIALSDAGTPTLSLTAAQWTADATAISEFAGNYALTVTGLTAAQVAGLAGNAHVASVTVSDSAAHVGANLDALQTLAAAGKLSPVTLTDGGTPTLSITGAQAAADLAALNDIAGPYSITLTDGGTPTLSLTSAQLVSEAKVISAITSTCTLSVPGLANSVATFIVQQDASGRGANGIALDVAGTAPAGSNSVVGFQNATFTNGFNTVVLDGPRSSYAIQIDANGRTTIKDIGSGDATFGQTVTISGESYILFNGAKLSLGAASYATAHFTDTASGNTVLDYPNNIDFVLTPANAQLAQFYNTILSWAPQPQLAGFEYWANQLAGGMSLTAIAQSFINTSFFQQTYGAALGSGHAQHVAYVELLYQNILGESLGDGNNGVQYWAGQMDNGVLTDATTLISFTNAMAYSSTINAVPGTAAGAGKGWLIDPGLTGGYADPGAQMPAQSVLTQAGTSNFYNLSLIDPSTVGTNGVSANGITVTAGAVQMGGTASAGTMVVLSPSFNQATISGSGYNLHDGLGTDTITVLGANNTIFVGSATTDTLNLAFGTNTTVSGFTAGHGSHLAVSGTVNETAVSLLDGTASAIKGASLDFGTAGAAKAYVVNIGAVGAGSAAAVAAAANAAYVVADVTGNATTGALGEHVIFIGTDSGGDAEIWAFRAPLSTATVGGQTLQVPIAGADTSGTHAVTAGEITHLATLIGIPATSLTAADLA